MISTTYKVSWECDGFYAFMDESMISMEVVSAVSCKSYSNRLTQCSTTIPDLIHDQLNIIGLIVLDFFHCSRATFLCPPYTAWIVITREKWGEGRREEGREKEENTIQIDLLLEFQYNNINNSGIHIVFSIDIWNNIGNTFQNVAGDTHTYTKAHETQKNLLKISWILTSNLTNFHHKLTRILIRLGFPNTQCVPIDPFHKTAIHI